MEASKGKTAYFFWSLDEWEGRANQLSKRMGKRMEIEQYLLDRVPECCLETRNVLYLYGGPDFCYPDLFFPHMENLILIGQEKMGTIPDPDRLLQTGILGNTMLEVGQSLAQIPFRSYFVTETMGSEFRQYGTAALLAVSIVLSDYQITGFEEGVLDKDGRFQTAKGEGLPLGFKIRYQRDRSDSERTVYYFCLDLNDRRSISLLSAFVKGVGIDTAFYKATSFLTQAEKKTEAACLALDHAKYIVQGESGLPFRFFDPDEWEVNLFGVYARPYYSTQSIPKFWGFQRDLRDAYLALIFLSGSEAAKEVALKIWGEDVCAAASSSVLPVHANWQGLFPMHFDYGGQLAEKKYVPYTTAVQVAIRKSAL